jgi:hypothetical protein
VQAASKRLDHRRHVRGQGVRYREHVPFRDARGDEHVLGVRAVQERPVLAERLLSPRARGALAARGRVGRHDATTRLDVDTGELVSERARRLGEQQRMTALERLGIRSIGERNLDLDDGVARAGLRVRHLFEAQVARSVEAQSPHGVKTTLTA